MLATQPEARPTIVTFMRPPAWKIFSNAMPAMMERENEKMCIRDRNMSAYIRKMVIDGYIVKLDMPELRELTLKMKSISNSENQIAKRVNSTGLSLIHI